MGLRSRTNRRNLSRRVLVRNCIPSRNLIRRSRKLKPSVTTTKSAQIPRRTP
nr:MAG TPA: hypothetical protein [Caudoviricetes sp.]